MVDVSWPVMLLALRIALAVALYLFLFIAIRALRAEVRARTTPYVAIPAASRATVPLPSPYSTSAPAYAPVSAAAPAAPRPRPAEARDRLEIVAHDMDGAPDGAAEGALRGRTFALRGPTLIGRAASNSIVLPEHHVSARHARVFPQDGAWWVEDLGSTNGTFVGEQRVTGRARLDPRDEVRFGPVVARLVPAGTR